jgi:hypothetical protein
MNISGEDVQRVFGGVVHARKWNQVAATMNANAAAEIRAALPTLDTVAASALIDGLKRGSAVSAWQALFRVPNTRGKGTVEDVQATCDAMNRIADEIAFAPYTNDRGRVLVGPADEAWLDD